MTGSDDYLPVMADCERALGRPQAAIKLAKEARRATSPALQVEMLIVEAGARADLGQQPEACGCCAEAVVRSDRRHATQPGRRVARLDYAYAEACCETARTARRGNGSPRRPSWTSTARRTRPSGVTSSTALIIGSTTPTRRPDPTEPETRARRWAVMAPAVVDGYDAALFDLDGVVYLGPVAVPGRPRVARPAGARRPGRLRHQQRRPASARGRRALRRARHRGRRRRRGDLGPGRCASARASVRSGATVLAVGGAGVWDALEEVGLVGVAFGGGRPVAVMQGSAPT